MGNPTNAIASKQALVSCSDKEKTTYKIEKHVLDLATHLVNFLAG